MEQLQGLVEHIVYHTDDNGYTVLNLMCQGDEIVCVGTMPVISEGEYIKAEGAYVNTPPTDSSLRSHPLA